MQSLRAFNYKWTNHIKNILNETSRPDIWFNQEDIESKKINKVIKEALIEQNHQMW